ASDFTITTGFDNLCRRLRDGNQTCQDFEEFMRQRADVEERYGKSLIRLARLSEAKDEIGYVFYPSKTHGILFVTVEEIVKRAQKMKKTHYDNTMKYKRSYEQKCRDQGAVDDALKKSHSLASKDDERLRSKLGRAKTAAEQADAAYQNSVRSLEEARVSWEYEMTICCNVSQDLEQERIAYLRNEMWIYTNLCSITCVKDDEMYENTRKSLELCDVDTDIKLFISMKQTGSEKPASIEYENYYMAQSSQKNSGVSGVPRDTAPNKMQHRPPAALPLIQTASEVFSPALSDAGNTGVDLDLYSTVNEVKPNPYYKQTQSASRQKERTCVALFDYDSQEEQELTFKEGDIIKIFYQEGGVWCCGQLGDQKGMFPLSFVKIMNN
ncbi:hypothetical protein QZH41_013415, partial [Actinostola sp. cb2023]